MIAPLLLALTAPIAATDSRIVTVGRFDRADPASIACEWSASEVRLRVRGNSLLFTAEDSAKDFWQVVVDGKPTEVVTVQGPPAEYRVSLGADAIHDVSLVKRTEPFVGTTRFRSFGLPNGDLLKAKRRPHTLEFVGDSITAAFGNEGASEKEHFKPETENAYMSYASMAARALDADVRILAWSGRKMWPDNTMPEIYDRILPDRPAPQPDPNDPAPDAVIVNLATNDFAPKNPDEAGWSAAYEAFVRRLRVKYPKAQIYATLGSMMTDDYPVGNLALSTARGYLNRLVARLNDPKLHFVEFARQRYEDGIGSDWHPNLVTHRKMALRLVEALEHDLHWKRNSSLDEPLLLRTIRPRDAARPLVKAVVKPALTTPKAIAQKHVVRRKRTYRYRTVRRRVNHGKAARPTKPVKSFRPAKLVGTHRFAGHARLSRKHLPRRVRSVRDHRFLRR